MTYSRVYRLTAKAGSSENLETELRELAANVVACPGSDGVQIYSELNRSEPVLVFAEAWRTIADWQDSKDHMPPGAFGALMAHVDGKPELIELSDIGAFQPAQ